MNQSVLLLAIITLLISRPCAASDFSVSGQATGYGVWNFIGNSTAPGGGPTAGGYLYAEGGALKWRGSSGTITTIAVA